MRQPTPRKSQMEAQIAQYNLYNENYRDDHQTRIVSTITVNDPHQRKSKTEDKIIIHYTHEHRFHLIKCDMHEIFREAFKNYGIDAVRLIVGHRKSPALQGELIRKRPNERMMKIPSRSEPNYSTGQRQLLSNPTTIPDQPNRCVDRTAIQPTKTFPF